MGIFFQKCDLCNKPVLRILPRNVVVGNPVKLQMCGAGRSVGINHDPKWLACGFCFDLISHNYWELLIARVMRALHIADDKPFELLLRLTYARAFDRPAILTGFISSLRPGVGVLNG